MNPEGLLNKIITGDENTLRQLFEQYSQRLYHVAYYYLQAKEPAEEAVLDVFTTVWKKRESLGHIKTIEQYLYTSTKIRHFIIFAEITLLIKRMFLYMKWS